MVSYSVGWYISESTDFILKNCESLRPMKKLSSLSISANFSSPAALEIAQKVPLYVCGSAKGSHKEKWGQEVSVEQKLVVPALLGKCRKWEGPWVEGWYLKCSSFLRKGKQAKTDFILSGRQRFPREVAKSVAANSLPTAIACIVAR